MKYLRIVWLWAAGRTVGIFRAATQKQSLRFLSSCKASPLASPLGPPVPHNGRALWWLAPLVGLLALFMLLISLEGPTPLRRQACWPLLWNYDEALDVADDFEGFDNETGVFSSSGEAVLVVPNVVHFLRMGLAEFSFLDYVCVLAAWQRQQPDWLMFHTDLWDFSGDYWQRLQRTPGLGEAIQIVVFNPATHVFGQPLDPAWAEWHASDIARIHILQKYGGIFLDNGAYLLSSFDPLRRYEMSVSWPEGEYIGNQVLVAHPDARFLRLWLESYRGAYVGTLRHYNSLQRPTELVLHGRPELVHREPVRLGVEKSLPDLDRVYDQLRTQLLVVHLFPSILWEQRGMGSVAALTEDTICNYNATILQMAQVVLPSLAWRLKGSRTSDVSFLLFMVTLWAVWRLNQSLKLFILYPRHVPCKSKVFGNALDRFTGFNNSAGLFDDAELLVPNVVHFLRLGELTEEVQPEEAASISAALRTQRGAEVVVHTDRVSLRGVAWERLQRQAGGRLSVRRRALPLHVFGVPFKEEATRYRVAALRILTKYGGVLVSNTTYLLADLSVYRKYECLTASLLSSVPNGVDQEDDPPVIAAHRDARQLRRWLNHFHDTRFTWPRRPVPSPDLCRTVDANAEFISVRGLSDPTDSAQVDTEDWYLWSKHLPVQSQ